MEKNNFLCISCFVLAAMTFNFSLAHAYYGKELCHYPEFSCLKVNKGDTWEKRWPNPEERNIVMRLNRTNLPLASRSRVVVPKNLDSLTVLDISPFPAKMDTAHKKLVRVDLSKLAFGAYNEQGQLVYWGPVSGGKKFCPDIDEPCETPTGTYQINVKRGADCFSSVFPVDTQGGAPMPYCMFFHEGYAIHGSDAVPGYLASHGCVRVYNEDAQWLNEEFTQIGTKVIITSDDSSSE